MGDEKGRKEEEKSKQIYDMNETPPWNQSWQQGLRIMLSAILIGRRDPGTRFIMHFSREHVILFETKLSSVCGAFLGVGGGMGQKDLSFLKANNTHTHLRTHPISSVQQLSPSN
jgi:hypothetical protein